MGCRNSVLEASSCFSLYQINKKIEQEFFFQHFHMTVTDENIRKNGGCGKKVRELFYKSKNLIMFKSLMSPFQ